MTAFPTCHTCALPAATCQTREALKAAITGLGLTSVKHRCASYAPAFMPGDAVKVETYAWFHRDGEGTSPKLWFPGHFIRLVGQRALVFVSHEAVSLNGDGVEFEPNGNGYLKVPMGRVRHRDAEPVDVTACTWCAAILSLGNPCGRDPHYTPRHQCALLTNQVSQETDAAQVDRDESRDGPKSDQGGRDG